MRRLVSLLLILLLPILSLGEEEEIKEKKEPAEKKTQTTSAAPTSLGNWHFDEKEKEYTLSPHGVLAFDPKSGGVTVKEKLNTDKMVAVEYQVGTKDGKPAFATIYTEDTKSVEKLKVVQDALKAFSNIDVMLCQGTKVCVQTCKKDNKEYCCKYKCQ